MEEELGKWLLDVAKYVLTALILSNAWSDMDNYHASIFGGVAFVSIMVCGLYLIKIGKDKERNKANNEKNRKSNKR